MCNRIFFCARKFYQWVTIWKISLVFIEKLYIDLIIELRVESRCWIPGLFHLLPHWLNLLLKGITFCIRSIAGNWFLKLLSCMEASSSRKHFLVYNFALLNFFQLRNVWKYKILIKWQNWSETICRFGNFIFSSYKHVHS